MRKEYLETLMNNDSAVVNARAQLEITEADIEELQAEIDLIEADISVAYHLDELNHARFKFIASNNMGSYESTRRKLLEIEAYYKVDEVAMGIRRHMDEIMPDKEKLWGLQKKLSALIKNNADNKVKDDLNDEIEELKKRIALKNKQLAMLKRTLLWHASRISQLANCSIQVQYRDERRGYLESIKQKRCCSGPGEISEELSKLSPTQQKYLLSNKERLGELALNSLLSSLKNLKEKKSIS